MTDSLSIVIADIDAILTKLLADLLAGHGHRVVPAPVPSHAAVRELTRTLTPDVCLLDLALQDGDSPDNIAQLVEDNPSVCVVIRTSNSSWESMHAALAAGAAGYVHKSCGEVALLETLCRVGDGEVTVQGSFTRAALPEVTTGTLELRRLVGYLTPRERECLIMLAEGRDTTAMAAALGVSRTTVRSHLQGMFAKLGVHSRLEAAAIAVRCNLMSEQPRSAPVTPLRTMPRSRPYQRLSS